jgi:hypothetical protein
MRSGTARLRCEDGRIVEERFIRMAIHDVTFEVPQRPLGKADVAFRVKEKGKTLGTLTVSNGSIVWFPRGTKNGLKMGWARFQTTMQEKAKR